MSEDPVDEIESLWVTVKGLKEENAEAQATITALREALADAHKAIEACLHAEQNPGNERIEAIAGEAIWKARKSKRQTLAATEPPAEKEPQP